jgi:LysM repeat protein
MKKQFLKFLGVAGLVLATAFASFSPTQTARAADGTITYTVQSGDNLSTIAQTYGTTVSAIMALNPQITDPNLIYPNEVLVIPVGLVTTLIIPITGATPAAIITPSSGPQGTQVQVVLSGFPADAGVEIGLHKLNRNLIESTADTTTDEYGSATVSMRIPVGANVDNNRVWLAQVSTTTGPSLTISSNEFVVSTGAVVYPGSFTYVVRSGDTLSQIAEEYGTSVSAILAANPQVTNSGDIYAGEELTIPVGQVVSPVIPITGAAPAALISPSSGPQGAYVEVIVSGFPAYTPVQIGLHKLDRKLIESHARATTDAYGSAVVTMRIPSGSNINNNRVWLAQVTTTNGENITVESNQFNVTGR